MLAAAGLLPAAPAAARTVDYARSEADFAKDVAELKVADFPQMPGRGPADVVVEGLPNLDQQLRILSISCKAYKVHNPLSGMVTKVLTAWDQDGQLGTRSSAPLVKLRFDRAFSSIRCVSQTEFKGRCLTRTSMEGAATVERAGQPVRSEPIRLEVEQEQSIGGVCGGLARGAGLSGRAASIALINRLKQLVSTN